VRCCPGSNLEDVQLPTIVASSVCNVLCRFDNDDDDDDDDDDDGRCRCNVGFDGLLLLSPPANLRSLPLCRVEISIWVDWVDWLD